MGKHDHWAKFLSNEDNLVHAGEHNPAAVQYSGMGPTWPWLACGLRDGFARRIPHEQITTCFGCILVRGAP